MGLTNLEGRKNRISSPVLGVLLLGGALFFVRLGDGVLVEDPARYAAVAKSILATGDWITMHIGREPYFNKPPLVFWLTALLFKALGVSVAAARFWSALAGAGSLILVYDLARSLAGPRAGVFSAVVLGLTNDFLRYVSAGRLDGPQVFFMCLAVWGFMRIRAGRSRWWGLLPGAAVGLGFLAKGPMTLFILPALVLAALWSREARLRLGAPFRLGILLGAALALPWFSAVAARNPEFLDRHFRHEMIGRLQGDWLSTKRRPDFVRVLLVHDLPWTPFALAGIWMAVGALRPAGGSMEKRHAPEREAASASSPEDRLGAAKLLLAWTGSLLLAVFIPPRMYGRYLVPLYPPLAILSAFALLKVVPARAAAHLERRLGLYALLLALGIFLMPRERHQSDEKYGILEMAPLIREWVPPGEKLPLYFADGLRAPEAVAFFYFDREGEFLKNAEAALETPSPLVLTSKGGLELLKPLGFQCLLERERLLLAGRDQSASPRSRAAFPP
ncbi:MAG: glycosyltransferase family 39 protein [Planctomycetota bacterium]